MNEEKKPATQTATPATPVAKKADKAPGDVPKKPKTVAKEIGGPSGLEPTRYGDWEKNGRCSDF